MIIYYDQNNFITMLAICRVTCREKKNLYLVAHGDLRVYSGSYFQTL